MKRPFLIRPWVLAVGLGLLLGCDAWGPPVVAEPSPAVRSSPPRARAEAAEPTPGFVGAKRCAACHETEYAAWLGSDHDLAMQRATEETVLGDFDDVEFSDAGETTRFRRVGDDFMILARDGAGQERDFSVRYVFGIHPLQQYLLDVGDGRLQAFPIAWDVEGQKWISLYPGQEIPPDDPLHWSRLAFNWNQGCADCHSTNLRKQYDVAADSYETVWSEINVSCEACHGPGSLHVAWALDQASAKPAQTQAEHGLLVDLGAGGFPGRDRRRQQAQLDTCAPCHSRRSVVHPVDSFGAALTEFYRPELLHEDLYHADGQILDEVYVYGSFLQSRMFQEGVVCTDCHEPHSLALKAEGDALCTQCHEAQEYETVAHTHHAAGTPASACVSCHMVETTYMQVDPRRDHGFHVPRPDLTVSLGIPNACTGCHADEPAVWAQGWIEQWFGPQRPDDIHETRVFAAARRGAPDAAEQLAGVVARADRSSIVRATALHLLRSYPSEAARGATLAALDDSEPLVRSTAVGNVAALAEEPQEFRVLIPMLEDPSRLVRTEAAQALSRVAPQFFADPGAKASRDFQAALAEYRHGQRAIADQPAGQMNLGIVSQNLGDQAAARLAYQRAQALEPAFVPARFNLAMLDAVAGRRAEAEQGFLEILDLAPDFHDARYSLGLLLAENPQRLDEAYGFLVEAARAERDVGRFQYNAGLAAQHLGRTGEAEGFLRTAVNLEPQNPTFTNALAILYVQQGRWGEALPQLERLRELVGARPEVERMLERARGLAHAQ